MRGSMSVGPVKKTSEVLKAEFTAIHGQGAWQALDAGEVDDIAKKMSAVPLDHSIVADEAEVRAQAAYFKSVHRLAASQGQTALCLSGGGIRSAAFCLGILQGLARRELLQQFNYLSTVSGGGYIGAWLTAWTHRAAVAEKSATATGDSVFATVEQLMGDRPALSPSEIDPLRWLRQNQKFLTPRAGLRSADTWAAVALLIRDLVLNWLVYIPLLAALLLVPRALESFLDWWTYYSVQDGPLDGGSVLGWFFHRTFPHLGETIPAVGGTTLPVQFPNWKGWFDLVGAVLVQFGMVTAIVNRTSQEGDGLCDRGFGWMVLFPITLGALCFVMFSARIVAFNSRPDHVFLLEWMVITPLVFVLARSIAQICILVRKPRGNTRSRGTFGSFVVESLALAFSGALMGLLVWAVLRIRYEAIAVPQAHPHDLAAFGVPLLLGGFVVAQIAYAGLTSRAGFGRRDQEWMARASGFYLLAALLWAAVAWLVLFSDDIWLKSYPLLVAAGTGALTIGTAVSTFTKATTAIAAAKGRVPLAAAVSLVCLIFLAFGTIVLTHTTLSLLRVPSAALLLEHLGVLDRPPPVDSMILATSLDGSLPKLLQAAARQILTLCLVAGAALTAISLIASLFVDVNLFSLHALYRNRLVRTFLGASNVRTVTGKTSRRSRFDGFAEGDDIPLDELWRRKGATSPVAKCGPFPVVNMALNLVRARDLAWQERKAAPFVATPLCVGGDLVGYSDHDPSDPLSLGTAMAISGAAASPNWGYHSSPLVGFVMMLFNVRLGWWLPNPGRPRRNWTPFRSIGLFRQEALGLTSDTDAHVYLSDGGHFDNLGLYEMLRRRCATIVVIDATADGDVTLEDLGSTLRKASVDLGITVNFDRVSMSKRQDPQVRGVYCAVGDIVYPEAPRWGRRNAKLVYVKPGFYDDAPADVRAYAAGNAKFPHDSTFNQWFTDSQFESYRTLGSHVIGRMLRSECTSGRMDISLLQQRAAHYIKSILTTEVAAVSRPAAGVRIIHDELHRAG